MVVISMGNAANMAKSRWNDAHYKQIKVSVDPELAAAFKRACRIADVSMAGEISKFMSEYCKTGKKRKTEVKDDFSTRRKRRKSVADIISRMECIRDAESLCHDNVPENLRGSSAYEDAEESLSTMDEVIDLLESIY